VELKLNFEITLNPSEKMADLLRELFTRKLIIRGGGMSFPDLEREGQRMPNYIVPRDHAPVNYVLNPFESVQDSEGDVSFSETFESDQPSVVRVIPGPDGIFSGQIEFGTDGIANLTRTLHANGKVGWSEAAHFTLIHGALTVTGGGMSFEGLEAEPEPVE
jgi:hypothetical protein